MRSIPRDDAEAPWSLGGRDVTTWRDEEVWHVALGDVAVGGVRTSREEVWSISVRGRAEATLGAWLVILRDGEVWSAFLGGRVTMGDGMPQ